MYYEKIQHTAPIARIKDATYKTLLNITNVHTSKKQNTSLLSLRLFKIYKAEKELDVSIEKPKRIITKKEYNDYNVDKKLDENVRRYRTQEKNDKIERRAIDIYSECRCFFKVLDFAVRLKHKFHLTFTYKKQNFKRDKSDQPLSVIQVYLAEIFLGVWKISGISDIKFMDQLISKSLLEALFPRVYKKLLFKFDIDKEQSVDLFDLIDKMDDETNICPKKPKKPIVKGKNNEEHPKEENNLILNQIDTNFCLQDVERGKILKPSYKLEEIMHEQSIGLEVLEHFNRTYRDKIDQLSEIFNTKFETSPKLQNYIFHNNVDNICSYIIIHDLSSYKRFFKIFKEYFDLNFKEAKIKLINYPLEKLGEWYCKYELRTHDKEMLARTYVKKDSKELDTYFKYLFLSRLFHILNL